MLILANEIKIGHQTLRGKSIYKIKRDDDCNMAHFKARYRVKSYLQ